MSWIKWLAIQEFGEDGFEEYLDKLNGYTLEPEEKK